MSLAYWLIRPWYLRFPGRIVLRFARLRANAESEPKEPAPGGQNFTVVDDDQELLNDSADSSTPAKRTAPAGRERESGPDSIQRVAL